MLHVSRYARGITLRTVMDGPRYDAGEYGSVDAIDHVAIYHEETGEITVFAVNRSDEPVALAFSGFGFAHDPVLAEHIAMEGDTDVRNTLHHPLACIPRTVHDSLENDGSCVRLNPYSWNVLRYDAGCR